MHHLESLCGKGEGWDEFRVRLAGVAIDTDVSLLAVGDREVKRFGTDGDCEGSFSTRDAGWSIAVEGQSIWVGMQGTIDCYDITGKLIDTIDDPNRLGRITGLAVNGNSLYAADATHFTIHLYQGGQWRREIGRDANTRGFMIPNGVLDIDLDIKGQSIVVAHSQKHRIERYALDGDFLSAFGRYGSEDAADFGGCCNPTNVAVFKNGLIAVSVKAPPRIKVFDALGVFVAESDSEHFDPNTKNIDLACDEHGHLYATDPLRCTIEVFELADPS